MTSSRVFLTLTRNVLTILKSMRTFHATLRTTGCQLCCCTASMGAHVGAPEQKPRRLTPTGLAAGEATRRMRNGRCFGKVAEKLAWRNRVKTQLKNVKNLKTVWAWPNIIMSTLTSLKHSQCHWLRTKTLEHESTGLYMYRWCCRLYCLHSVKTLSRFPTVLCKGFRTLGHVTYLVDFLSEKK